MTMNPHLDVNWVAETLLKFTSVPRVYTTTEKEYWEAVARYLVVEIQKEQLASRIAQVRLEHPDD